MAVLTGAFMAHSQGFVVLSDATANTVQTNGSSIGQGTGRTANTANGFFYELLDMTSASYTGLTGTQQSGAAALLQNSTAVSLWTDAGVSGVNTGGLTSGGVVGQGGNGGTTAANWGAPTGSTYATGPTDYYVIVGWSSNEGTTWATVSAELTSGNWNVSGSGAGGWFGETGVFFNESGNPAQSLNAVNVWGTSGATTLAGSGTPGGTGILQLMPVVPVPEPTTLALAGLGGISMLFLRRRKA